MLVEALPYLACGTLMYLLVRPLLSVVHELALAATAGLLHAFASAAANAALNGQLPFDPVYTATMFMLLADVEVAGVAVAQPVGQLLHQLLPGVFASPELVVPGAAASAILQPGGSVIARGITTLSAAVALLVLGLLLVRVGLRARWSLVLRGRSLVWSRWLAVAGAIVQAHIVVDHLAGEPITLSDLEATGLTYGFSVLFTGPASERPRLSTLLLALPEPWRDAVLILAAVATAYTLALALVFGPSLLAWLGRVVRRWRRRSESIHGGHRPAVLEAAAVARLAGLAVFALIVAASPLGDLAAAQSHYQTLSTDDVPDQAFDDPALVGAPVSAPSPAPARSPTAPPRAPTPVPAAAAAPTGPTAVTVSGSDYRYTYQVGSQPQVIRGMGYNPMYAHLSRAERAALYDRDFGAMRQAGVNTILGWVTEEFDGLLLDKAHQHGLGVILPYHLDPDVDYTDPLLREATAEDVLTWVRTHRDHPAIRMWGIGNEVLHKLVFPSWMKLMADPILEQRADAFATFYVDLIDRVHRLDPRHPVTYRDAEDAYLGRLREALKVDGKARPWFVYGINIYTPRLSEVIASWPSHGLDAALLISEFGPGGASPAERPRGYRELWAMIRSQPERVLGGAPYVWTTQGPEEVDRIFGLVDANGQPVDGSLAAISRLYHGELAAEPEAAGRAIGAQPCNAEVTELFLRTLHDLRANPHEIVYQASEPPSIMGVLENLPVDAVRSADLRFARVDDRARLAWQRKAGYQAEWWVVWTPPSRPDTQLVLLVRDRKGQWEVAYVYHGAATKPVGGWQC